MTSTHNNNTRTFEALCVHAACRQLRLNDGRHQVRAEALLGVQRIVQGGSRRGTQPDFQKGGLPGGPHELVLWYVVVCV